PGAAPGCRPRSARPRPGGADRTAGPSSGGEQDPERRAAAGAVLDPGVAVVEAGQLGHQGQADPGPGGVGGAAGTAVERPEDRLALLGGDPGAGVVDAQQGAPAPGGGPDPRGRARGG